MQKTKTSVICNDIIGLLKNSAEPLTLDYILKLTRINHPKTAFSTVYRIMKRLEQEKLVLRVDWRERGSNYEWAELLHHHHITCTVCGQTRDVDDSVVSFDLEHLTAVTGYTFRNHYVELEGICATCREHSTT
jgi:Fe2+ or Zn2+ uptake regulation protein